ncbi:ATP-dependent helicase, partial [Candidatus Peregrinibacteria bacterium]|nr:ATP-dependent helicase [Candidatus Peregrinibacteria bacterium]
MPAGTILRRKMDRFTEEYGKLNQEQRSAVDAIEGPVMVVAGPGTGKTQVTALRVANILRRTHMRPSNILCLTFSVSGATAMRERLRALVGPDAYGVTIATMHGFCNDIIAGNPVVFDSWSALEKVSDVERYRIVNSSIDALLPDLALVNPKNPHRRTRDILDRIAQVKREGKIQDDLTQATSIFAQEMEEQSSIGTKAYERDLLSARKVREFTEVFRWYQEVLEKTQRYDYEDMILYVLRALEEHEWLLQSLQERYQYILVDEFQDTNGAQCRLINLLTTYQTLDHEPNLFVVGDDDQAIYRFQGANLLNLLQFRERFPRAPVIVLTTSYRCSQPILDAAGSLIAKNTERLVGKIPGLRKELVAGNPLSLGERVRVRGPPPLGEGIVPTLYHVPSDTAEPWVIADIVEECMGEGIPAGEIAVLTQTNAELLPIVEVCRARGLPVDMRGKVDLLHHPLVCQAIAILRAIENPLDSAHLAGALACACFGCHPADCGRLFAARRDRKCSLHDILLELERGEWRLQLHDADHIIAARDVLLDLHQKLPSRTVVETVEHTLKECDLLLPITYNLQPTTSFDPLAFVPLQSFFDYIKYRAYEQPGYTFDVLMADLDLYGNPEYQGLRLTYETPHCTESGVQLMTAHQSKGLEFDVVILPNFREGHWDRRRNPPSLMLPEHLLFGWEKGQKSFEQGQDERRVCYVAMTRARRELLMTCSREQTRGEKVRSVSPSAFFAEAGELPEADRVPHDPERMSTLLREPLRDIDDEFQAFLRERLKSFTLSVTALNHFLDDPRKFLELDLLQTPQSKEASLVYGNAVHAALRQWGLSVQKGCPLSLEEFLRAFRRYLSEREILTVKERDNLFHVGSAALPRYYAVRLSGK